MQLDINQFDLNNIDSVGFIKTGDAYLLTNTSTGPRFALYGHPTKLPIGTRVKWSAELKFISDFPGQISLTFYSDNQFTTGEVTAISSKVVSLDDGNDDWQKLEISGIVPAGTQYVQGRIGSVFGTHSPGSDSFEFRNVKFEIDTGINTIFPELQESQTYNRTFAADNIENAFELFTANAGTATRVSDTYELRAGGVLADEAMLTIDEVPATAHMAIFQPNAKYVKIRVKAQWIAGLARIVINFIPTYGSIASQTTKYAYLVSKTMQWHEVILAVPDGTDVVTVFAGMDDGIIGSVDVDAIQISLLGGETAQGIKPFLANLLKTGGTWAIDNGPGSFGNINITGIAQSATELTLDVNLANTKPIFIAEYLDAGGSPEDAYAKIFSVDESTGEVKVRLYGPGSGGINPTTVTDGGIIRLMGFATV